MENISKKTSLLEKITELTKKLIEIHSVDRDKKGLQECIAFTGNQLSEFNIQKFISNGKPSLLVHNAQSNTKHFNIILNGHLDVVPGEKNQFKPYIENGKLFGRGAYDMKAATAVMLLLFKYLAKTIDYPLALQLVTDEEIGGHNGTKYQIEKGVTADFVIAGEFTDYKIIHKAKSPLWIKIKTHGKVAHGAYPWLGKNALLKMYDLVKKLETLYPTPKKEAWQTTINLAKIETPNNTFNKVPDECTTWLDVRAIPEEEDIILQKIKNALPKDTEIEIVMKERPYFTNRDNPFIKELQKSITLVTKKTSEIKGTQGASDVRFYTTPVVEF